MAGMARGPMKDFRFDGEDGKRQHIEDAVPVETYLVKYFNQEGKQQVRLAFIVPETDIGLVGAHSISASQVFVPASNWFMKQLKKLIGSKEGVESL